MKNKIYWQNWDFLTRLVCRFLHGWSETTTVQERDTGTRHFQCGQCRRAFWGFVEKPGQAARRAAWPLRPLGH
jgi:hypothetical protein